MLIKVNKECEVNRQCKGFTTTRLSSSRLQMGLLKHLATVATLFRHKSNSLIRNGKSAKKLGSVQIFRCLF